MAPKPPPAGSEVPPSAANLLPLVYEELRRLAAHRLSYEKPGQTLQATALVHEAWLRLAGEGDHPWASSTQFFSAAAEAMRRILVERARHKQRLKHGAGERVELDALELAAPLPDEDLLALDEALTQFERLDPLAASLVKLRFFAGMTHAQAASHLGVSRSAADRIWVFARAWLFSRIRPPGGPEEKTLKQSSPPRRVY